MHAVNPKVNVPPRVLMDEARAAADAADAAKRRGESLGGHVTTDEGRLQLFAAIDRTIKCRD